MNSNPASTTSPKNRKLTLAGAALSLFVLVIFAWFYLVEPLAQLPFPNADFWNDKVEDLFYALPALAAALLATVLARHFAPTEPPRRVWLNFAVAWWWWVGAELLGMTYDLWYFHADLPELTWIDLCWLMGYAFLGLALYHQFRLIYGRTQGRKTIWYFVYLGAALVITAGLTQWAQAEGLGEGISWLALFVALLYPVFDVVEGLAALWLFLLFQRGYLGRPWWGLAAFAVADAVGVFLWIGGLDWAAAPVYDAVDLFAAVTYLGGTLVTVLALLSTLRHIQGGTFSDDSKSAGARD